MSQRAKFAGAEAGIGIIVLSLFFVLGLLAVVGVGVLLVTGQVQADSGERATFAVFAVAVGLWGASLVRDLRAVRVVEIAEDGTWILRGPLGLSRGRIAPDVPREVHSYSRKVWIVGVPRRYTQSWSTIEAGGRRWRTCGGIPETQRPAAELLRTSRG